VSKSHALACCSAGRCQSLMHRHAILLEGVKVSCTGMLSSWKVSKSYAPACCSAGRCRKSLAVWRWLATAFGQQDVTVICTVHFCRWLHENQTGAPESGDSQRNRWCSQGENLKASAFKAKVWTFEAKALSIRPEQKYRYAVHLTAWQ